MSDVTPKKVIRQFEKWWEDHGQYMRAGGRQYEKTFAYEAWVAAEKKYRNSEGKKLRKK